MYSKRIKFHTQWFSAARMICCSKMLGLQILCCLNIYDHRFSYWSCKHVIFDEGGNKMLENKWGIARWIGSKKCFFNNCLHNININIDIDIDWLTSMGNWQRPSNEGNKLVELVNPANPWSLVSVAGKRVFICVPLNALGHWAWHSKK